MSETPRSPDNPDDTDARPDVADTDPPQGVTQTEAPAFVNAPDSEPQDTDESDHASDDDPMAGADEDEAREASGVVIPEFERRLTEAANAADTDSIASIQREYNQARLDRVREANSE